MKFKTTQKAIKNNYDKIFAVGYCELCNLLQFEKPIAYTCGVYGWNADIYTFGGVALVTGYRPFGKSVSFELVQEYDNQAREIINGKSGAERLPFEERRALVQKLLAVFIQELQKL